MTNDKCVTVDTKNARRASMDNFYYLISSYWITFTIFYYLIGKEIQQDSHAWSFL